MAMFKPVQKKENLMNTYTNSVHPKKVVSQTTRNRLFNNSVSITVVLALVIAAVTAIYMANRPVAAENNPSVTYSNALEMQYAQPWLDAQNKPVVAYSNALELQYAQPWLDVQSNLIVSYGNALELQYAQPWLDAQQQILLNCHSSLEILYACQNGYDR